MSKSSKLDLQKKIQVRSERVKSVDVHPSEPWLLATQYNGQVIIWNWETQAASKTFHASDLPIRCGKFIARQHWFACGSDDLCLRIYNYNTHERMYQVQAHTDYIRAIAVHPTKPLILTGADDLQIKMWDWEKGMTCTRTFDGHAHYVMSLAFHPKDPSTFASASLDRSIKVWSIHANSPNYTLEGHAAGVCALAYYPGGDKPYLASGGDDKTVRIWDYQNKHCVATLTGHLNNVTSVTFHPQLPLLLSGGEDDTLRVWHMATFVQEKSFALAMDRVWSVAVSDISATAAAANNTSEGSQPIVAIGTDKGVLAVVLGAPAGPLIVVDSAGKALWLQDNQVFTGSLKSTSPSVIDGETFTLPGKEFGHVDISPTKLVMAPNGRFVALIGASEYIIYSSLAWRSRAFGDGSDFVWADDSQSYAVLQQSRVQLYSQFEPTSTIVGMSAIFGGPLLTGIQQDGGYLCFWRWADLTLMRRMDVPNVRAIFWNAEGSSVAVATETDGVFILAYTSPTSGKPSEDGFEDAFQLVDSILEDVVSALWVHGCFVYTNKLGKLMYWCGPSSVSSESGASSVDEPILATVNGSLIHYQESTGKLFIATSKGAKLTTVTLPKALIEAQLAIHAGTPVTMVLQDILPAIIEASHRLIFAKFLERQGFIREAISVTPDFQHGFDLACKVMDSSLALFMLQEKTKDGSTHDLKKLWLSLADMALQQHNIPLLETCYQEAKQHTSLMMLYSLQQDFTKLLYLANDAETPRHVAFWAALLSKDRLAVQGMLKKSGKFPELALFARAQGFALSEDVKVAWKRQLDQTTHNDLSPCKVEEDEFLESPDTQAVLNGLKQMAIQEPTEVSSMLPHDSTFDFTPDLVDADIPDITPSVTQSRSPVITTNMSSSNTISSEKKSSIQYKSPELILSPKIAHTISSGVSPTISESGFSPRLESGFFPKKESDVLPNFEGGVSASEFQYQDEFNVRDTFDQSNSLLAYGARARPNGTSSMPLQHGATDPNVLDYQASSPPENFAVNAPLSDDIFNPQNISSENAAAQQELVDDWDDFQEPAQDYEQIQNLKPAKSSLYSANYDTIQQPASFEHRDAAPATYLASISRPDSNTFASGNAYTFLPETHTTSAPPPSIPINPKQFIPASSKPNQAPEAPISKSTAPAFKLGRPAATSTSASTASPTQIPPLMKSSSKED